MKTRSAGLGWQRKRLPKDAHPRKSQFGRDRVAFYSLALANAMVVWLGIRAWNGIGGIV